MLTTMPTAPPRPCATQGCGNLVQRGHCENCRKAKEQRRGTAAARGYGADWQALRLRHLQAHPLCAPCQAEKVITVATTVDHKKAWQSGATEAEREQLRTDPNNLESMCQTHHNKKTIAQDGGFGRKRATTE